MSACLKPEQVAGGGVHGGPGDRDLLALHPVRGSSCVGRRSGASMPSSAFLAALWSSAPDPICNRVEDVEVSTSWAVEGDKVDIAPPRNQVVLGEAAAQHNRSDRVDLRERICDDHDSFPVVINVEGDPIW